MRFKSNSIFDAPITANSVADAGTNTDKFLVLDSSGVVSYRTALELYNDLGIGALPAGYTSTVKHSVKAGVALTKGQAVYVTGADGTNMIVGKASNASEATSSKTMGLIESSLSVNGQGVVITEGLLSGLDTTGANTEGDPVWLGTDGNLIYGLTNKPSAPAHLVFIGVVTRINANNGEIFVSVQNGFEMKELHNYAEGSVQNNEVIVYESATSLYKPKSIATILGYTPANAATYVPYTGATSNVDLGTRTLTASSLISSALSITSTATTTAATISNINGSAGSTLVLSNISVGGNTLEVNKSGSGYALKVTGYSSFSQGFETQGQVQIIDNRLYIVSVSGAPQDVYARIEFAGAYMEYRPTTIVMNDKQSVYSKTLTLKQSTLTADYNIIFPDASGTVALTSNLSSYTPTSRTITINGTTYDLSANRSWTISTGVSGSGTTGYIPKFTGSGSIGNSIINENTNTIFITGGLNVSQGASISGSGGMFPQLTITADTNTQIRIQAPSTSYTSAVMFWAGPSTPYGLVEYNNSSNALIFYANSTAGARLNSNGTFSIGNTNTTYNLDVTGTGRFTGALTANSFVKSGGTSAQILMADGSVLTAGSGITISGGTISSSGGGGSVTGGFSLTTQGNANNTPSTPSANMGVYAGTYAFIDLSTSDTNGGWIDFSKANGTDFSGRIRYENSSDTFQIFTAGTKNLTFDGSANLSLAGGSGSSQSSLSSGLVSFRFPNQYSSGYTDAGVKLYIFNSGSTIQGFTAGPAYDLQYHSSGSDSGRHAFYVNNSEIIRFNKTNVAISGQATLSATGIANSASMRINTSSSASFVHTQENFAANLTSGQRAMIFFGKNGSTKNAGGIGYYWAGDASNSNFITLGHWGNDDLFRVYADGSVTVGTNTVVHSGNIGSYKANGAIKLWAESHPNDFYIVNNWTGSHWYMTSNHGSPVRVGYADSAGNADTVDGYHGSNYLGKNGNNYYQQDTWIQINGLHGLYCPSINGAHFYPNDASYGAWRVSGTRNGWNGIHVGDVTLMMNSNESGHHREGYGWQFRWNDGTMYCHKSSYGGGTSATMFDTSNYTSWAIARGGDTVSGVFYFMKNNGGYCGSLNSASMQAYAEANNSAYISFHKGGYYAVNMGLDADNVIRIGGWSASANRFQMDMSGNLTMAGDITAYSDARVKENVKTIDNALTKILALRGVSYTRTDSDDKKTKIGVIAQETLPIVPEVVNQDNSGMYNVAYGNMAGLFIEAFKEQQSKIDAQDKVINELKNIINGLTK